MKKFITLTLLLFAAILSPLLASAQDMSAITDIFTQPTGSKTLTVVLILLGDVLYFIALYKLKKWRAPQTIGNAGIWLKDNWANIAFFLAMIWLIYTYATATTFSVGGALMFGATSNLAIDWLQNWVTHSSKS